MSLIPKNDFHKKIKTRFFFWLKGNIIHSLFEVLTRVTIFYLNFTTRYRSGNFVDKNNITHTKTTYTWCLP